MGYSKALKTGGKPQACLKVSGVPRAGAEPLAYACLEVSGVPRAGAKRLDDGMRTDGRPRTGGPISPLMRASILLEIITAVKASGVDAADLRRRGVNWSPRTTQQWLNDGRGLAREKVFTVAQVLDADLPGLAGWMRSVSTLEWLWRQARLIAADEIDDLCAGDLRGIARKKPEVGTAIRDLILPLRAFARRLRANVSAHADLVVTLVRFNAALVSLEAMAREVSELSVVCERLRALHIDREEHTGRALLAFCDAVAELYGRWPICTSR